MHQGGYRILEGRAHGALATVHLADGRHDQAIAHAEQALALHRASGHRLGQARVLLTLGHVLRHTRGPDEAAACWREAAALFSDIGAAHHH